MRNYHQTKGACLLLDDPRFYSNIKALGEFTKEEAILDGTYVYTDDICPSVKTISRHLQQKLTVSGKEPPTLMSLDAYRESWKIVKENTLSQGPHIGMYKATAQHLLLGWILHQKSDIPYLSGYSLRRHLTGTNVMLPKK